MELNQRLIKKGHLCELIALMLLLPAVILAEEDRAHAHDDTLSTSIAPAVAAQSGIQVKTVQGGVIEQHVSVFGHLVVPPSKQAQVRARFPGQVIALHAKTGDMVEEDQLLATVESNASLQRYYVRAPMVGVVQKQWVGVGEITSDTPLFTLLDTTTLWAELSVFPRQRTKVKVGQRVHVQHNGHDHEGRIQSMVSTVGAQQSLPLVLAQVPLTNIYGDMAPGDKVRALIDVQVVQAAQRVERRAVQRIDDQSVVFVRQNDTYQALPVTLGIADDAYVQVLNGLSVGANYVVENSYLIKADLGKSTAEHSH